MQTRGVAPELHAPFTTSPTPPQTVALEETLAILQQTNTDLTRENERLRLANRELRERLRAYEVMAINTLAGQDPQA